MVNKIKAYAALEEKGKLVPWEFEQRPMRDNDVIMDILYAGICHSDIHNVNGDWGKGHFPMVPGHEIVGRIIKVGSKVSKLKVGDLAAIGCMVDSCQRCNPCKHDLEQYCENGSTLTYHGIDRIDGSTTYGGYSQQIIAREEFVLSVPANLDLKAVAPILCAGITTWSPLKHWNVKPGDNVAVIGLGGLGHMAIKLAAALGANVSLFSRSPNKEADAKALGAKEVIISTDEVQMKAAKGKFSLIIDTVPYKHDLRPYVNTLGIDGTLVIVGYLGDTNEILNTVPMIMGRKSIAGSVIGGIKETQELLDFCGKHNIVSEVEMINIQDINTAYERMLKSDVKYRFVIDINSLK
ncbi:MAG: NAD(P)-dependent alcohol dehydrogenase [Alphaproteobacteria bacterium]|nr:NAD(P)-dependent alcohol dehydrogenase [Alphaproteobacteria bacterium]